MAVWNPSAVRIAVNLSQGTRPMVNVFHVNFGATPTLGTQMDLVAQFAFNTYAATILTVLSNTVQLDSVQAYSLASSTAVAGSYNEVEGPSGTVDGDPLPLQSAAVITWRTAGRGRSGRGRTYVSGWTESQQVQGALQATPLAQLETAVQAFYAAFLAEEWPLCVYSQFTEGAPRAIGLLQQITGFEVRSPVFGSQRDRNQREDSA